MKNNKLITDYKLNIYQKNNKKIQIIKNKLSKTKKINIFAYIVPEHIELLIISQKQFLQLLISVPDLVLDDVQPGDLLRVAVDLEVAQLLGDTQETVVVRCF